MANKESISIEVDHEARIAKKYEKLPILGAPRPENRYGKSLAVTDFVVRLGAVACVLGGTATMGMADQALPFFTQFFQFEAGYDDFPTFSFFVIAMSLVGGYLVLSLPLSIVAIMRPHAVGLRLSLIIMDTVALTLAASASAAATAIVYLAHNGNASANWMAVCMQFTDFCQATSGATISALIGVACIAILIIVSAFAIKRTN